jgi:hypothetical protein
MNLLPAGASAPAARRGRIRPRQAGRAGAGVRHPPHRVPGSREAEPQPREPEFRVVDVDRQEVAMGDFAKHPAAGESFRPRGPLDAAVLEPVADRPAPRLRNDGLDGELLRSDAADSEKRRSRRRSLQAAAK